MSESTNTSTAASGERPARPGETCGCGRTAVIAYPTDDGERPFCGQHSPESAPAMTAADVTREFEAIEADWEAHCAAGEVIMERVRALHRTTRAMLAEDGS